MKIRNRLISIAVIIGIVLSMLVERAKSSENRRVPFEVHSNNVCIPPCTIISESDKVRLEDYTKEDMRYIFIKNLSTGKKNYKMFNSDNTTDIIVVEDNKHLNMSGYRLYTCFYREVEENGKIKKQYISHEEATGEEKKILIVPEYIDDRFVTLLKEVKSQLKNPDENTKIKSTVELMKRVLNLMMCQLYVNDSTSIHNKKRLKTYIEGIGMKNTTAYSLVSREVKFTEQNDLTELFYYFEYKRESIRSLVYDASLENELTKEEIRNINDIKSVFSEETKTIASQIMNRKQSYTEKTKDDLLRDFIKNLEILINVLIGNRDEILEEKVKDRLIKGMNKFTQPLNRNRMATTNKLYDRINNHKNLPYIIGENTMRTESSTEKEEELAKKVKQTFKRKISSDSANLVLNSSKIVENVKPWNRGLFTLLNGLLTKYRRFNGTAEELIKEITADNAQIASEILNKREKWYSIYKNIFIIIQVVENEFAQIKKIIKNRVDTDDDAQRKKTTKEDNEKIIRILESISIETNFVTEEEQRVIKALKEMSLEEEQEDMLLEEEESRDIQTILSEIAEEYTKPETYKVTDKAIQMKKQEIARIVLKKFPIITEDSGIPEVKEHLTEMVDSLVDILADGTVDHAQYKGFKSVKEEIKEEEEYIRKQDLISMFDFVFEFVEKHTYIRLDDSFCINDYELLSVSKNYIAQIKNSIGTENEKAVNFLLPNSVAQIYKFIGFVWSLKNTDSKIGILKNYDELWLNATSFNYHSKPVSSLSIGNPACIMYKPVMDNIKIEKNIKPTNKNLQTFMKARTVKDIKSIPKYRHSNPNITTFYPIYQLFSK